MMFALVKLAHHVGGNAEQIGQRFTHQFHIAHPQQPGKHFLRQIVGIRCVIDAADQKALQLTRMSIEQVSGETGGGIDALQSYPLPFSVVATQNPVVALGE